MKDLEKKEAIILLILMKIILIYMCITKEKSKKQKCAMCNVDGDLLDKLVLEEIFKYNVEGSAVNTQLSKLRKQINSAEDIIAVQIKSLNSKRKTNEKAIQNLIKAISDGASTLTMKYINKQITELTESNSIIDAQIAELNDKEKIQSQMHVNLNNMEEAIIHLKNNFAELSIENKREFIKKIIEKVTWDGENAIFQGLGCQGFGNRSCSGSYHNVVGNACFGGSYIAYNVLVLLHTAFSDFLRLVPVFLGYFLDINSPVFGPGFCYNRGVFPACGACYRRVCTCILRG